MAKRRYVLAIDQGTTGTHVSILDDELEVVGKAYREFTQHFPKPGWVEHDLEEIWKTVERCIAQGAGAMRGVKGPDIAAIGITNQRETTAAVEPRAPGKPLHHAIVWQDRRTADICAELKARGRGAAGARDDRAGARPVLLRHQAPLAARPREGRARPGRGGRAVLRHHRHLARLQAHRRRGARHRRLQRQPHAADGPAARCGWDDEMLRAARRAALGAAGDPQLGRGVRHDARA